MSVTGEAKGQGSDSAVAVPADADLVIKAFRLGWTLAELRGRCRPDAPPTLHPSLGARAEHALPLFDERSVPEQLIELQNAVTGLASELKVNGEVDLNESNKIKRSARFSQLVADLQSSHTQTQWSQFTEFVYEWDAHIQDRLVIEGSQSAAYQLGRGLAETYWALDPTIEDGRDWRSWQFLLGTRRCRTFGRLVARLVDYVDPLTPAAVTTSLDAWATLATDPVRRKQSGVIEALHDQALLWRDLVRAERRPEDLAASENPFTRIGIIWPVLKTFYLQIVIVLIGAGALAFSASELAAGSSTKANTLVAVLSGLGITSAALYARAKGIANALIDQLRTVFARDRVGAAATLAPKPPRTIATVLVPSSQPQVDSASPRLTRGMS